MSDLTADTFFNGRIIVRQEQDGYRYSIDAVILAYHAGNGPGGGSWIWEPVAGLFR